MEDVRSAIGLAQAGIIYSIAFTMRTEGKEKALKSNLFYIGPHLGRKAHILIDHAFPADPQISIHLTVRAATFSIPSSISLVCGILPT